MEGGGGGGVNCLSEILKGIPERYQNFVWLVHLRLHLPRRGTNRKHNFSYCYFFFVVPAFCLRFSSRIVGARRIGHGASRAASCKAASHEDRGRCALVYRGQRLRCSPLGPRHPRFFARLTRRKTTTEIEKTPARSLSFDRSKVVSLFWCFYFFRKPLCNVNKQNVLIRRLHIFFLYSFTSFDLLI